MSLSQFPVALLAGGLATRLRPLTEKIPKVLLPLAGRPFLAHQLQLLRERGITRAVLCLGHLGEMVHDEFGDGSAHASNLSLPGNLAHQCAPLRADISSAEVPECALSPEMPGGVCRQLSLVPSSIQSNPTRLTHNGPSG